MLFWPSYCCMRVVFPFYCCISKLKTNSLTGYRPRDLVHGKRQMQYWATLPTCEKPCVMHNRSFMAQKSLNMIEKIMDLNIIDYYIINCAKPSIITIEKRYQMDFGKPARNQQRNQGCTKINWIKNVEKDLNRLGPNLERAKLTALDRPVWEVL